MIINLGKVSGFGLFGVFVFLDFYYDRNNLENNLEEKLFLLLLRGWGFFWDVFCFVDLEID